MLADTFGIKNPGPSEGRTYREYRHARRTERVKNVHEETFRRYRQYPLQSFLQLEGGFASRVVQPLYMSAPEYFDFLEADLRTRAVDDATYLRVTVSDYELLKSNTRDIREAAPDPRQTRTLQMVTGRG